MDEHNQIQKAMAFRVKYRLDPVRPSRRQPLQSMGVHMMNRNVRDSYPNGVDVRADRKHAARARLD